VVALIDNFEATLKYLEQSAEQVLLLPANANISALCYRPEQVTIQGVLVGQMRRYRSH
jgi:repressor LexA